MPGADSIGNIFVIVGVVAGIYPGFRYLGERQEPKITGSPYQGVFTGTVVDIYGENFTGTTAVAFGGTPATSFTVVNDGYLQAVVGNGSTGEVTITTPQGSVSGLWFTYYPHRPSYSFLCLSGPQKATLLLLWASI